jgi:hypothetical protein
VTIERDKHSLKHKLHSFSTEEGMQIDKSDEQFAKAPPSMHESLEPDSNVTVARE